MHIFLFLSYSFGIEKNKYVHFFFKMSKIFTRFQTKKAQTPYPSGRHVPMWLIRGSTIPLPPPRWLDSRVYSFEMCLRDISFLIN